MRVVILSLILILGQLLATVKSFYTYIFKYIYLFFSHTLHSLPQFPIPPTLPGPHHLPSPPDPLLIFECRTVKDIFIEFCGFFFNF